MFGLSPEEQSARILEAQALTVRRQPGGIDE